MNQIYFEAKGEALAGEDRDDQGRVRPEDGDTETECEGAVQIQEPGNHLQGGRRNGRAFRDACGLH